jgi:hypothetical protein
MVERFKARVNAGPGRPGMDSSPSPEARNMHDERSMHDDWMPVLPMNQARWDRALRIVLGVALFALGLSGLFAESIAVGLRIAAIIPLATGGLGWCPIYDVFRTGTRGCPLRE